MTPTGCCVYDNPDTMSRELYRDAERVAFVSHVVLTAQGTVPSLRMPRTFDVGPFVPGNVHGDVTHLPDGLWKR